MENSTKSTSQLLPEDPWWLHKAFAEIGTKEVKGKKDNPKIIEYHSWTTLASDNDEVPWCAAFVRWVFKRKGPANARSLLTFGKPVECTRGAVVVLSRDSAGPYAGHVGFLLEWYFDAKKNKHMLVVLGGNQGDEVSILHLPKSRVLGFRWPPQELASLKEGV